MHKNIFNKNSLVVMTGALAVLVLICWSIAIALQNSKLNKDIKLELAEYKRMGNYAVQLKQYRDQRERMPHSVSEVDRQNTITYLETLGRKKGVSFSSITPRTEIKGSQKKVKELTIELQIKELSMSKLIPFLHAVESEGFFLKIKAIRAELKNIEERSWKVKITTSTFLKGA